MPLLPSQIKELKEANEGLISIIPEIKADCALGEFASRKNLSASELFTEYYKSMYSDEPPKDLLELFMEISEARDET